MLFYPFQDIPGTAPHSPPASSPALSVSRLSCSKQTEEKLINYLFHKSNKTH